MTTKAEIMIKLNNLSHEDQEKLLAYIETLPSATTPQGQRKSAMGMFEHLGIDVTREMIDEARKEAWASFPREFPVGGKRMSQGLLLDTHSRAYCFSLPPCLASCMPFRGLFRYASKFATGLPWTRRMPITEKSPLAATTFCHSACVNE
jgi:hypothetical protein